MSRPINLPILERAREGVLVKSPGTLLDELVDEFGCGRRTANRYVARARREVAAETAARMGERVGMFYAKLDRAVEEAKGRGNDSAVMAGLKVEREALGLGTKAPTVNVAIMQQLGGAAPGETFDKFDPTLLDERERGELRQLMRKAAGLPVPDASHQDLSRLDDAELAIMIALSSKAEGDPRATEQADVRLALAHLPVFVARIAALESGSAGEKAAALSLLQPTPAEARALEHRLWLRTGQQARPALAATCAPALPDAAQDAAERTPRGSSAKPGGYRAWQAKRGRTAQEAGDADVPSRQAPLTRDRLRPPSPKAREADDDAAEPDHFSTSDPDAD